MTLNRARASGFFSLDEHGKPIARTRVCGCGREFQQFLLSERFLTAAERHSARAIDMVQKQMPDLHVPVNCPACESRELTRYIGLGEGLPFAVPVRPRITDRERFARNMAQLCAAWNRPVDQETSAIYWRTLERSLTDDEFERGVLGALRVERKWPAPSVIIMHAKAA